MLQYVKGEDNMIELYVLQECRLVLLEKTTVTHYINNNNNNK